MKNFMKPKTKQTPDTSQKDLEATAGNNVGGSGSMHSSYSSLQGKPIELQQISGSIDDNSNDAMQSYSSLKSDEMGEKKSISIATDQPYPPSSRSQYYTTSIVSDVSQMPSSSLHHSESLAQTYHNTLHSVKSIGDESVASFPTLRLPTANYRSDQVSTRAMYTPSVTSRFYVAQDQRNSNITALNGENDSVYSN